MRVSLNWIKKYVDIPKDITPSKIAYDLTMRTVEVEKVEDVSQKYHDIIVGQIKEVRNHPNADLLKVCMVDIGEEKDVQIVCGGSNLYENEKVVVCKPGAEVVWHGEGEPILIKETKMRGELSYGMICAASEVFLDDFFPAKSETEIIDLGDLECKPGDSIADLVCMNDIVLEIDNKSLTNRPDLWGHYGIAREIATIYKLPLKELPKVELDKKLPKYPVEIKEKEKCNRYTATEIDNVYVKDSPLWMKADLINGGMRPINALVDITNYVMLAVGQPLHAFDKKQVEGGKIIVRNAKKGEKLLLLDDNEITLTEDDLVICDTKEPMGLAGIRGGKKDSILPDTNSVVVEIANFTAKTIRKTDKRFDEKTESSIRYEKGIDTERINDGVNLTLTLFKELYPECKIISYVDEYPIKTERTCIDVPKEFLDTRLGKVLDNEVITDILTRLGYEVKLSNNIYHVIAPVWRSTGDVSIKDDVMGDIVRLIGYENFEAKPLTVNFEHAVLQRDVSLERRLREYLAFRCGFNEIFTYPWIDEKYINAAKIDVSNNIRLATPPAPELAILRSSLIPGIIEAISKNLRYYDTFRIFEMAEVFEKGEYHESTEEEILPIHKKYLTGAVVSKNAKNSFFDVKGIIEEISSYTHMEELTFARKEKPTWADKDAYLNIMLGEEEIGQIGLLSVAAMSDAGIKRTSVAIFEINTNKLVPLKSRTNEFNSLPSFPLVEKDLSLLVDENVTWNEIKEAVGLMVKKLEFIEEYRGNQIPENKKSIMLRVKIGNKDSTMTAEQINSKIGAVIKVLNKKCGAILREE